MATAREFLMIVRESALGTVMTSPVAGTDSIYIRLTDSNSFSMVADPVIQTIPYGGGLAIDDDVVSDHYECKGQLKTKLYPSQVALLMNWAITRINSGQTSPWATSEAAGDLASCSVYHGVVHKGGTVIRKRFAGAKVAGGTVEVSQQNPGAMLSLDLIATRSFGNAMDASTDPDATEFPEPADSDYPTGPYTLRHTAGGFTVGSVRTEYESISLKWTNTLDGRFFETAYMTALPFCGRKSTLESSMLLKATPNDRSAYEAITAQAVSLKFDNGSKATTISFNGKNHISKLPKDLPLGKQFMQKLSLSNRYDHTAGGDISVSVV